MMAQDFKTAHLLGVCPRAQFVAMLLGSAVSAAVSVAAYTLYTSAWQVPGPDFPAPTAEIWLDMADLVSACVLPFTSVSGLLVNDLGRVIVVGWPTQRDVERLVPH